MSPVDTNWPEERNTPQEWPAQPHSLPHGFRAPGDAPAPARPSQHACPFTAADLLIIVALITARKSPAPGAARIAAKAKQHMDQHHPTQTEGA